MARLAVVLLNLGGPDSPEAVQPFLFNLFHDPAIIGIPQPLRWVLARLISRRRAPTPPWSASPWGLRSRPSSPSAASFGAAGRAEAAWGSRRRGSVAGCSSRQAASGLPP